MGSHYHTWLGRTAGVRKVLATLTLVLLCLPKAAMAHHMPDGEVPRTFFAGLLSGLAHPVIGPDHLAFILAVGIIAAAFGQGRIFPLVFLGASLAGCVDSPDGRHRSGRRDRGRSFSRRRRCVPRRGQEGSPVAARRRIRARRSVSRARLWRVGCGSGGRRHSGLICWGWS